MSAPEHLPPSEDEVADELQRGGVEGVYYRWLNKCGRSYLDLLITLARGRRLRRWQGAS